MDWKKPISDLGNQKKRLGTAPWCLARITVHWFSVQVLSISDLSFCQKLQQTTVFSEARIQNSQSFPLTSTISQKSPSFLLFDILFHFREKFLLRSEYREMQRLYTEALMEMAQSLFEECKNAGDGV